jgi:hypothetical protein
VLERLIGGLGGPVTPASLPRALALLEALTDEPPAGAHVGPDAAVADAVRRGIVADLRRYLEAEAADGCDWVPSALELRFGFEEDGEEALPALLLADGERSVRMRGTIDRVDVDPGGGRAIVRDYKSGANRPGRAAARWLLEHELQVGLYMIAVQRLRGLAPIAGFYQPLTGRDLRPRGVQLADAAICERAFSTDQLDRERLVELLTGVERDAVSIAAALARGELSPCPATCSRDGCRHPGICWAG